MPTTYTVAGISHHPTQSGMSLRFANGTPKARASVLRNNGHTDIDLRELPEPMTPEQAVNWLQTQGVSVSGLAVYSRGRTSDSSDGSIYSSTLTQQARKLMTAYDYVSEDVALQSKIVQSIKDSLEKLKGELPAQEAELKRLIALQKTVQPPAVKKIADTTKIPTNAAEIFAKYRMDFEATPAFGEFKAANPKPKGKSASGFDSMFNGKLNEELNGYLSALAVEIDRYALQPSAKALSKLLSTAETSIPRIDKEDNAGYTNRIQGIVGAWKAIRKAAADADEKQTKAIQKRMASAKKAAATPDSTAKQLIDGPKDGIIDTNNANDKQEENKEQVA